MNGECNKMVNAIRGSSFDAGRSFDKVNWPGGIEFNIKRLSFSAQAMKRAARFGNVPLTLYLRVRTPDGDGFLRVADLLVGGRFDSKAPAAAVNVVAFEIVTPEKIVLANPSVPDGKNPVEVDVYLSEVDMFQQMVASRTGTSQAGSIQYVGAPPAAPLDLGLLFDSKSDMVAMAGETTVGQARQWVQETEYKPEEGSHNAAMFNGLIENGQGSDIMVFTNERDCLKFAEWALPKVQARYRSRGIEILTLDLPTDQQWQNMRRIFRQKQTGNFWERLSDNFSRSFPDGDRSGYFICFPVNRSFGLTFRLVGTYRKVTP